MWLLLEFLHDSSPMGSLFLPLFQRDLLYLRGDCFEQLVQEPVTLLMKRGWSSELRYNGPPTLKKTRSLQDTGISVVCLHIVQVHLPTVLVRHDLASVKEKCPVSDDQIAEFDCPFIASADSGHSDKTWMKLLKDGFEVESCLQRSLIWKPGKMESEWLSLIVPYRCIPIFVVVSCAEALLKLHPAPA